MTTSEKSFYPPVTASCDAATSMATASPVPASPSTPFNGSVIISITAPALSGRPQITIMSQAMEQVYQGPTSDIPDVLRAYVAEAFDLVYHPRPTSSAPTSASTAAAADPPSYVDAVTPEAHRVYSRALDSKLSAKKQLREARKIAKQTIHEVRKMVKEQRHAVRVVARDAKSAKRHAKHESKKVKRDAKLAAEDAKLAAKRAKLHASGIDGSSMTPPAPPMPPMPPLAPKARASDGAKVVFVARDAQDSEPKSSSSSSVVLKVFGQEYRLGGGKSKSKPTSSRSTRRDSISSLSSLSSISSMSSMSSLSSDSSESDANDSDYDRSLYVPVRGPASVGGRFDEKQAQ